MKRRSVALRVVGPLLFLVAYPGCMLLVSDGDYKVDPGAFTDGGTTGASGVTGTSGAASGTHAPEGGSGASGTTGSAGAAGASTGSGSGATGTTGASGVAGTTGSSGSVAGASGAAGTAGESGASGSAAGSAGTTGITGTTGATGATGTSIPTDAGVDQSEADAGSDAGRDAEQDAGADSGSDICNAQSGDDDCDTCQRSSCCSPLKACGTDCLNIFNCVSNCVETSSTAPCDCLEQYPDGVSEYLAMNTCVDTSCDDECDVIVDNGDPCVIDDECDSYLSCYSNAPHYGGNWCADDGCGSDFDCSSATTNSGNNSYGEPISCVRDGRTTTCFPGCQSDADCVPFPGTTCQPATSVDDVSVMICELP